MFPGRFIRLYDNDTSKEKKKKKEEEEKKKKEKNERRKWKEQKEEEVKKDSREKEFIHAYIATLKDRGETQEQKVVFCVIKSNCCLTFKY